MTITVGYSSTAMSRIAGFARRYKSQVQNLLHGFNQECEAKRAESLKLWAQWNSFTRHHKPTKKHQLVRSEKSAKLRLEEDSFYLRAEALREILDRVDSDKDSLSFWKLNSAYTGAYRYSQLAGQSAFYAPVDPLKRVLDDLSKNPADESYSPAFKQVIFEYLDKAMLPALEDYIRFKQLVAPWWVNLRHAVGIGANRFKLRNYYAAVRDKLATKYGNRPLFGLEMKEADIVLGSPKGKLNPMIFAESAAMPRKVELAGLSPYRVGSHRSVHSRSRHVRSRSADSHTSDRSKRSGFSPVGGTPDKAMTSIVAGGYGVRVNEAYNAAQVLKRHASGRRALSPTHAHN
jgi:hypothetical protein